MPPGTEGSRRGWLSYLGQGLRYTLEVNDRAGRLSATGYWATNQPDPAYDRDDDDGDGRWEEAEITAGGVAPEPGRVYTTLMQFSRWHSKRQKGACEWLWDRRLGQAEILSQLSRELLGEWQAERYTLAYDTFDYPRVEPRARPAGRQPDGALRRPAARTGAVGRGGHLLPAAGLDGVPGPAFGRRGTLDGLRGASGGIPRMS